LACGLGFGLLRIAKPLSAPATFAGGVALINPNPNPNPRYTLVHRKGTKGFAPQNTSEQGGFACIQAMYKRLPALGELPPSRCTLAVALALALALALTLTLTLTRRAPLR